MYIAAYHEQTEGITNTLHKKFVCAKVFLIDVQHLRIVKIAHHEQSDEKSDYHIYASQSEEACTDTNTQGDELSAPKDEI